MRQILASFCMFSMFIFSLFSASEQEPHVHLKDVINTYSPRNKEVLFFQVCKRKNSDEIKKRLKTEHSPRTILSVLLKLEVDINVQNESGQTALHIASAENNSELVKKLIEARADLNLQDVKGQTPLHIACKGGYTEIAQQLMAAGADCTIKDQERNYPRDLIFPKRESI